ncbi:MAG: hypothetical protein GIX03_11545 [Candidatus Eremiobacteraeota bacterium]|nr:hypothetical protein [Candidatus Eremiobacteraeota bacterium]MBC5803603.1 hypothetical protein [Candidatus Eremiobacteraeota bacterium]MBC5823080.1 hypothetical protein [Candidatus Eremiobacteraeota bacterium]
MNGKRSTIAVVFLTVLMAAIGLLRLTLARARRAAVRVRRHDITEKNVVVRVATDFEMQEEADDAGDDDDVDAEFEGEPGFETHDDSFVALGSLEEARDMDHTAVIMQGGDGAQIYLTVPAKYVRCDEAALRKLLTALDALAWKRPSAAALSFELAPIGSGVFSDLGGGSIVDGIWLHPRLESAGVRPLAEDILFARRPVPDVLDEFPHRERVR